MRQPILRLKGVRRYIESTMKKTNVRLPELLKTSRNNAGLSQKAISEKLGYTSSQFISNWERGVSSPPMDKLVEICSILSIPQEKMIETVMYETELNLLSHMRASNKIKMAK